MKALLIQLNSQRHCLAGLPNGGIEVSVGWAKKQSDSPYHISVYGVDLETEQVSLWPDAILQVGDEVKIVVVDVDHADQPEH